MTDDRKYPPFDFLVGRLIRDAEEGTAGTRDVVKFSVAVNKSFTKGDDFLVGVTVFGDRIRPGAASLRKGDRVAMEGTLKQREYNDKTYIDFVPMSLYRLTEVRVEDEDEL